MIGFVSVMICLALPHASAASPFYDSDDLATGASQHLHVHANATHPHPPCCGAKGTKPPPGQPSCSTGPCTACRTPGANACCPCLPEMPRLPDCVTPETCLNLSTARGYGVGLGMLDALVYAGGFKVSRSPHR